MHRVLKPGGTLTIVSDNRLYATALGKIVDDLNSGSALFSSPAVDRMSDSDDDADDDGYSEYASQKKRKRQFHRSQQEAMSMLSDDSDSDDSDNDTNSVVVASGDKKNAASASTCTIKKTSVWSGDPGRSAGHVATQVSSYFRRLWKNGNKSKVWYLYLQKPA
mmetsp:Transcript_35433/g.66129  ORF Transcript_35433/g.66129 Transcript_35433/m.66129 type:complete len:163 (+) Transcript_35433:95-583(+)